MARIPEDLLRSTFAEFDKDGNGYLSPKELAPMLHMVATRHGLKFSEKEVKEICEEAHRKLDKDQDGKVTCDEFILVIQEMKRIPIGP